MTTQTIVSDRERQVSLYRPSYLINAERRSDGSLYIPNRVLNGERVQRYIVESEKLTLGGAPAAASAKEPAKAEAEKVEASEGEAVKG